VAFSSAESNQSEMGRQVSNRRFCERKERERGNTIVDNSCKSKEDTSIVTKPNLKIELGYK